MRDASGVPVKCFSVSILLLRPDEQNSGFETLLLRRTDTLAGIWCQVAGKVELGEKAWETALRECREETSLVPQSLYSADFCEQFYEADRDCITLVPTFVGYVGRDDEVVLNEEHDASEWVSFAKAVEMLTFDGQKDMFAHVERVFALARPTDWLKIDF